MIMKKLILIPFICVTCFAFAQTVKGSKAIGGGFTYSKTTEPAYLSEEESSSSFDITPGFGYFLADGFMLGLNLGYSSGKTIAFGSETTSSGFQVGPVARYYKHTSNESFAIYGQLSFLYGSGKETDTGNNETKNSSMDIAVSPGLAYFFNNHWAVELGFRGIGYYSSDPNKDVDNDNTNTFEIGLNSFLPSTLGLRFHF
jgi:hypothetical protein